MLLFLCFLLILFSFTPVFPTHALGPVSVSLVQASVLFPLHPPFLHPYVLVHASHTSTLHLAHQQLLRFLLSCFVTSIILLLY